MFILLIVSTLSYIQDSMARKGGQPRGLLVQERAVRLNVLLRHYKDFVLRLLVCDGARASSTRERPKDHDQ